VRSKEIFYQDERGKKSLVFVCSLKKKKENNKDSNLTPTVFLILHGQWK
jgi:hypothetical protein